MKACCLGLTLSVLLSLSAAAEQPATPPAPGGQPKARSAPHETGEHPRQGEAHRKHGHPPGCACCTGQPILIAPLFSQGGYGYGYGGGSGGYGGGYGGYGGGLGGYNGISIGQPWYSPVSPFDLFSSVNRFRAAPSRRPRRVRRTRSAMSSPEARARAARHLELGDRSFHEQKYARAMGRYRRAIKAAPDRAEARFRLAQAYFATGKFNQAVEAIARGLLLDPSWPEGDFNVKQFYDGNELSRLAHLEKLAEAVRDDRDNADLLFLLGYQLYFGDEPDRALPFFERAWDLAHNPDLVLPFLQAPPRELVEKLDDAPDDHLPPRPSPDDPVEESGPADSTPPASQKI